MRQALADALDACDWAELVGTAVNGRTASVKVQSYAPDIVYLGSIGSSADAARCATDLSERGFEVLLACQEGRELGGVVAAPSVHRVTRTNDADQQFTAIAQALGVAAPLADAVADAVADAPAIAAAATDEHPAAPAKESLGDTIKLVVIAASTGGPEAIQKVLPRLPKGFATPLLLVQHLPEGFSESMADGLRPTSSVAVREARTGDTLDPGCALIAPGGLQTLVRREGSRRTVEVSEGPADAPCRPWVDMTLASIADAIGGDVLVVMMTGMGSDGTIGCTRLRQLGAQIVAQDEATCTVFGMPRGPIERGLVDAVLPLEDLADEIARRCLPSAAGGRG